MTDPFEKILTLTVREAEVLEQLGLGRSTYEIASELGLSFKTVQCHCQHITTKLKAKDCVKLRYLAFRWVEHKKKAGITLRPARRPYRLEYNAA